MEVVHLPRPHPAASIRSAVVLLVTVVDAYLLSQTEHPTASCARRILLHGVVLYSPRALPNAIIFRHCFAAMGLTKHHTPTLLVQNKTPFVDGTSPSLPTTGLHAILNATASALNALSAR